MIKIYDKIIQGTDEWKELRWRKIGGSSLEKVMANADKSVKENAIFFELLSEMCEEFDPFESDFLSSAMQRGNEYEPLAAEEFERITGKKCSEIGWAELEDGFTGISPDRLIGKNEALEIKCPSRNTYAKYLVNNDIAITDYAWQLVQYFVVFENLETLYFMIFRPENKINSFIIIKITKDTEIVVNKKKKSKISDLVIEAKTRIEVLKNELQNELKNLQKPKF